MNSFQWNISVIVPMKMEDSVLYGEKVRKYETVLTLAPEQVITYK